VFFLLLFPEGDLTMKILAILGLAISAVACGSEARAANISKFMPENNLGDSDCVYCESLSERPVTEAVFNKIIEAGKKAYAARAKTNKEKLVINNKWLDKTVNADCSRYNGIVTVNMYGGLARRDEITPEGFALVLSHELNHAYGGAPFYTNSDRMSGEGQADYMSTKDAYAKIAALVPELQQDITTDSFVLNTCTKTYGNQTNNKYRDCLHALEGGKALANLLAVLNGDTVANYETPDPTVVKKTITTYPATTQCRLDSYLLGELNKPRPACWFKN
jgi:hypothetical protein